MATEVWPVVNKENQHLGCRWWYKHDTANSILFWLYLLQNAILYPG